MKSYVWVRTSDGSIQQVEEVVAMFCPMICREIHQTGMGSSKNYAVSLPERVNSATLGLILEYCRFHQIPGRSNKERKIFDEKYIRMDTKRLCELTSAADSLQLRSLVDLTSRALARIIEGKTPEEIRLTFHLPDDLTEEEKLEPIKSFLDDPRVRLLNRLYARKRKELKEKTKEREKLKSVELKELVDERSVDDLLSFINSADGDSKECRRASKSKRKNRRKKVLTKDSINFSRENGTAALPSSDLHKSGINNGVGASHSTSPPPEATCLSSKIEFDDADIDDDLDPVMKEELDREVEDFARRLNSDWPERMQEILSSSQERRHLPFSMNQKASPHR